MKGLPLGAVELRVTVVADLRTTVTANMTAPSRVRKRWERDRIR